VPLDATNAVPVPADFAQTLPDDDTAAGADIAREIYTQSPWLTEGASFWDTLAVLALVDPSLVRWEDMTATIELDGPSSGHILRSADGRPLRAAMDADRERFMEALQGALGRGEPRVRN
jgi:inosine-uridine nucleoside N-ribohydrolase